MITPNTLQIDNRISYQGYLATVTALGPHFVHFCIDGEDHDSVRKYEDVDPIPITEERLRDAGFVPKNVGFPDEYLTFDGKLFWWKVCRNEFFFHKTESGSVVMGAWHDLQNIVRLISGKDI